MSIWFIIIYFNQCLHCKTFRRFSMIQKIPPLLDLLVDICWHITHDMKNWKYESCWNFENYIHRSIQNITWYTNPVRNILHNKLMINDARYFVLSNANKELRMDVPSEILSLSLWVCSASNDLIFEFITAMGIYMFHRHEPMPLGKHNF